MSSPKPARRPESQSRFRPALHELDDRIVPAANVSLSDLQQFINLTPQYKAGLNYVQSQNFSYAKPAPAPLKAAVTTIKEQSNDIVRRLTELQADLKAQAAQQAQEFQQRVDELLAQSRATTQQRVQDIQGQIDSAGGPAAVPVVAFLRNQQGQLVRVQAEVEQRFQDLKGTQVGNIVRFYDQAGRALGVTIAQAAQNAAVADVLEDQLAATPPDAGGQSGSGSAAGAGGGTATPAGAAPASAASLFQQALTGNDQQTAAALQQLYQDEQLTPDMVNALVQSGRISAAAGAQLQGLIQQQSGGGAVGGGAAGGSTGGGGTGGSGTGGSGTGTGGGGTNTGGGGTNTAGGVVVGTYRRADQPTSSSQGFGNTDPPPQSVTLTLNANGTGSITVAPFDGTPFTATFPYTVNGNSVSADANGVSLLGVTVNGSVLRGGIDVTRGGKSLSFSGQRSNPNDQLQLTRR